MREWTCNDERLDRFIGEVNFAISKTKEIVPEIVPGKYCRWCPAVSACPEAEKHRMQAILPTYVSMDGLKKTGLPNIVELSVERIAEILTMRDMVEEWLEAVHKQAVAMARRGVAIPNKKLVMAQAKSKWNGEPRVLAGQLNAISGLPPNVFMKEKLITITEAKQIIKNQIYTTHGKSKKLVEEANKALAELTIKDTSGNLVLVDREDNRPEINIAAMMEYKPVQT